MVVDFDYGELLTISCCLHCLDVVYGDNPARYELMKKVDGLLDDMNNLPVDQIYPGLIPVICNVD